MLRKNHYKVPKQINSILSLKSKMTERAGKEISFSEALACWLAFGYADQFIENQTENG